MNSFDQSLTYFLNGVIGHWKSVDIFIASISANPILKGGAIGAVLWWSWFKNEKDSTRNHIILSFAN